MQCEIIIDTRTNNKLKAGGAFRVSSTYFSSCYTLCLRICAKYFDTVTPKTKICSFSVQPSPRSNASVYSRSGVLSNAGSTHHSDCTRQLLLPPTSLHNLTPTNSTPPSTHAGENLIHTLHEELGQLFLQVVVKSQTSKV